VIYINYTRAHTASRVAETGPSCAQLFREHVWEIGPTKRDIPGSHDSNQQGLLSSETRARVGVVYL
jgi:hypothetical protein